MFSVVDDRTIRCGLGAIKNVGLGAIESIVAAREAHGPFGSLAAVCRHIDLRLANRKVIESLIKSGACDGLGHTRAALLAALDQALEDAGRVQKDRIRGQFTLFDDLAESPGQAPPAAARSAATGPREWPESQKLAYEKALLGFYVSGHPLARHRRAIDALASATSQRLLELEDGALVTVGGMLTKLKVTTTRKTNEQMAVCALEDLEGEVEVLVFPGSFAQLAPQLKPNAVVFVIGRIALREDRPRLIAQQIIPIDQGPAQLAQAVELILRQPGVEKTFLEQLRGLLAKFPGSLPVFVRLDVPEQAPTRLRLAEGFKVDPRGELLEGLKALLGEEAVVLKRHSLSALLTSSGRAPPRRGRNGSGLDSATASVLP
jgi:DNA polymerase-3 subunit alpha